MQEIGDDLVSQVTDDYPKDDSNEFSGKIHCVRFDLGENKVSHLEPQELKFYRSLAR